MKIKIHIIYVTYDIKNFGDFNFILKGGMGSFQKPNFNIPLGHLREEGGGQNLCSQFN